MCSTHIHKMHAQRDDAKTTIFGERWTIENTKTRNDTTIAHILTFESALCPQLNSKQAIAICLNFIAMQLILRPTESACNEKCRREMYNLFANSRQIEKHSLDEMHSFLKRNSHCSLTKIEFYLTQFLRRIKNSHYFNDFFFCCCCCCMKISLKLFNLSLLLNRESLFNRRKWMQFLCFTMYIIIMRIIENNFPSSSSHRSFVRSQFPR